MNVALRERQRHARPASCIVVIGASAGGLAVLDEVLGSLPRDFPAAIAIVLHRAPHSVDHLDPLVSVLQRSTELRVEEATSGDTPMAGTVYVAPASMHLVLTPDKRFDVVDGLRIRGLRSSANPLFESAARVYGTKTIGLVLSGGDHDATDGVQSVAAAGGTVVVQDPISCKVSGMPSAAIGTGAVKCVLPIAEIAGELQRLVLDRS